MIFPLSQAKSQQWHPITSSKTPPKAVCFREITYLSLEAVAELIACEIAFVDPDQPLGMQALRLKTIDKEWIFLNGGDRIKERSIAQIKQTMLNHPLLVLKGSHYLSTEDTVQFFDCEVQVGALEALVFFYGKERRFSIVNAHSPYLSHTISDYAPIHETVILKEPLSCKSSLWTETCEEKLPANTKLLLRRTCVVDGVPSAIVTTIDSQLKSYIVAEKILRTCSLKSSLRDSMYEKYRAWFISQLSQKKALLCGFRNLLENKVCLTIDFCWSMRPIEQELVKALIKHSGEGCKEIHPLFFMSGRWLEQHPEEMHNLIVLGNCKNINPVWGGHSWAHPKSGELMNDFTLPLFQEDTLRAEMVLLEWGIVPTVFYRFPGLFHDQVHLEKTIELDLFPIDCDSWQARLVNNEKNPFAQPIRAGSIILVHGNGNEPAGILPLLKWLEENSQWQLESIRSFLRI